MAWKLQEGTRCLLILVNLMKTTAAHRRPPEEVLAFLLGKQKFGIDIRSVQEICGFEAFARNTAEVDLAKGTARLHGASAPIVDLRVCLAAGEPVFDESTSVIVLNVDGRILILVADGISDVHQMDTAQLQPAPKKKGMLCTNCLIGLWNDGQHMITLIAVEKLMTAACEMA